MDDSSDEDTPQESQGSGTNLTESPVLKGKGKRRKVILDSDEEEEEEMENGGVKNGRATPEKEDKGKEKLKSRETSPIGSTPQSEAADGGSTVNNGGSAVKMFTPPRRMTGTTGIRPLNP